MTSTTNNKPSVTFSLSNMDIILPGLRGISNGKRDQYAIVRIYPEQGITFLTTDVSKSLQCTVSVSNRLFDSWVLDETEEYDSFRLNLAILLDCLSMALSTHTTLTFTYRPEDEIVALRLVGDIAITDCSLRVICDDHGGDDDGLDLGNAFSNSEQVNKAIMQSDKLHDAFTELTDLPGATTVTVTLSPRICSFSTVGDAGKCDIEFKGKESFTLFDCPHTFQFQYRLSILAQSAKLLPDSEKTFIRMNSQGYLSIQHLIRLAEGQKTYADFTLVPDMGISDVIDGDTV
jgi:cell cycle checkpoint protein